MFLGWSGNATAAANKDDYIAMAPLVNTNGEQIWRTVDAKILSKGSFAITNQAEHPEVLMRWIDESYDLETSLEICQGLIGHALEITEDGRYQQMELPEGTTLDTVIHDFGPGNDGTFAVMKPIIEKLNLNANLTERKELDEFYSQYNVPAEEMYPNVFFTEDEIEEIGVLQTDIDSYVSQKYDGWIVEGGVEEEWDSFQKKLKDMNVDRYIEIYKTAYDWEYMPGGHVSGGTLSLLQHKEMGMLLCAGMGEYSLKEPNNMQGPDKVRQECLALRIETLIDGRIYSSIYEEQAEVTCRQEQDTVYLKVEGVLKDIDHNQSNSEELPYYFEYQFGENKLQISAFFSKGKLILPFISKSEEIIVVCQNTHQINCVKNGHEVILKLYGKVELPYSTNRIFNLIPGLQAVRMDMKPEEGANIARIQILW